jgi:phosphatidylglycerophosphatase A
MSGNQPLARAVATFGGLGDRLPAPGTTVGSLPPALLWLGLCAVLPTNPLRVALTAVGLVVFAVVGIWSSEIEAERRREGDPRPIVVDEAAGQWLTFLVALPFLPVLTTTQYRRRRPRGRILRSGLPDHRLESVCLRLDGLTAAQLVLSGGDQIKAGAV